MRIVLFFLLTTLACAFGKPKASAKHVPTLDGRIVGGSPVDITQYPHQISLLYYESHLCGGSIISPKWVLSAAHCVLNRYIDYFSVRVGSSIRNSGGTVISAKNVLYHAYYDQYIYDYDISAVELSSMLTYTASIQPIELPYADQHINHGTMLTITGWGNTVQGGAASNQLLAVDVPVVSLPDCEASYNAAGYEVTERMLCAGYEEGGKDACQGDSGGPLVNGGVLYGIVSWGIGCASPSFYGVNAHVSNLRSWISQVTEV